MKAIQSVSAVTTPILALLLMGLAPGHAHAQETMPLKFTLPFEARWGPAILPAGEYSLSVESTNLSGFVIVRREPQGDAVALVRADSWEQADFPDHSKLVVEQRGEKATVRAMYLEDRRLIFHYASHAAKGELPNRRSKPIQQTLLFAAAK
jgi:hypothetical protein